MRAEIIALHARRKPTLDEIIDANLDRSTEELAEAVFKLYPELTIEALSARLRRSAKADLVEADALERFGRERSR